MEKPSFVSISILGIVSSVIFYGYFVTLSPTIAGGDSGEIVAEGCQLGTAHPPGYPLMTVFVYFLSKLADMLGKTPAYLVNISSAFLTATAAFFIGLLVYELSRFKSLSGPILAMSLFSFSPLIWQYAITAEVFPLNTALAAIIPYLVMRFSKTGNTRIAIFGAWLCGMALCNQHTIILYEVPLILWMLFLLRRKVFFTEDKTYKLLMELSVAFIVGILPYFYLPISALISPKPGSWGHVTTISGFLHHFLRKDYGTFQLFSGATGKQTENMWQRHSSYWKDFSTIQTFPGTSFLAVLGAFAVIIIGFVFEYNYSSFGQRSSSLGTDSQSIEKDIADSSSIGSSDSKASGLTNRKKGGKKAESSSTTPSKIVKLNKKPSKSVELVDGISPSEMKLTPAILVFTHLFYLFVFHSLSNLPLSDRLLYGVHQRFWMQPNILIFTWVGVAVNAGTGLAAEMLFPRIVSSETVMKVLKALLQIISLVLTVYLSFQQFQRNHFVSDQHDAFHFRNYARAILTSLPKDAILLINYDQQWTSIRYQQLCESYRPDVISIQVSMMSYDWFQHKRHIYDPSLVQGQSTNNTNPALGRKVYFPGTFLSYEGSPKIAKQNAFTLISFLNENILKPHPQDDALYSKERSVFVGGKLSSFDHRLEEFYELVPHGLVSEFVPVHGIANGSVYLPKLVNSWEVVQSYLASLPSIDKYSEETWEWTIGRDYKDRLQGKQLISPPPLHSSLIGFFFRLGFLLVVHSSEHCESGSTAPNRCYLLD
jgi:hypothetical protein